MEYFAFTFRGSATFEDESTGSFLTATMLQSQYVRNPYSEKMKSLASVNDPSKSFARIDVNELTKS